MDEGAVQPHRVRDLVEGRLLLGFRELVDLGGDELESLRFLLEHTPGCGESMACCTKLFLAPRSRQCRILYVQGARRRGLNLEISSQELKNRKKRNKDNKGNNETIFIIVIKGDIKNNTSYEFYWQ